MIYNFLNDLRHIHSFRVLLTHIKIKIKQKLPFKFTRENFLGFTLYFPDYDWFANMWRETFILEQYYFKTENKTPRIIDIGSNIGLTVCYFKYLYPNCEITAVEPDPTACDYLRKNVDANNFSRVLTLGFALTEGKKFTTLYQDTKLEASGVGSTLKDFLPEERVKELNVLGVSLRELGKADYLKLCAEGVEHEIKDFKGIKQIGMLVHQRDGKQEKMSELLKTLEEQGFRYAITQSRIEHRDFVERPERAYAFQIDAVKI